MHSWFLIRTGPFSQKHAGPTRSDGRSQNEIKNNNKKQGNNHRYCRRKHLENIGMYGCIYKQRVVMRSSVVLGRCCRYISRYYVRECTLYAPQP